MNPRIRVSMALAATFALASVAAAGAETGSIRPAVAGPAIPQALSGQPLRPLSLATADFDRDGVADLAAGFAAPDGSGVVVLYRGNIDALYPHSPEARQRRIDGRFVGEPFLPTERVLTLSAPPDFLQAGDFDGDGNADLACGSRTGLIVIASGDGALGFRDPIRVHAAGRLDALAAGDVGRRDGLPDLIAAVQDGFGPRALVFRGPEGALHSAPGSVALDETAGSITIASVNGRAEIRLRTVSGAPRRLEASGSSWRLAGPAEESAAQEKAAAASENEATSLSVRVGPSAGGRVVLRADGSLSVFAPAPASTFVVDSTANTDDAAPGNGVCAASGGECSLRAAIQEANAHAGADSITFAIPGSGVPQISVPALPVATETVTIDGTTQSAGRVMVTGTSNGSVITLAANDCVLRGVVLNGTGNNGLKIQGDDNVVEGNFFGTTADGSATQGGIFGPDVYVFSGTGNLIGGTAAAARNVIAGGSYGVFIDSGATTVQGNYIGTDVTGTLDLGSLNQGVRAFTGDGNTIGGVVAGAGNLVSGNATVGISLETNDNLVQGNRVGTDVSGAAPIPNGDFGVRVYFSVDNTIGGTAAGAGNLISGNAGGGVRLDAGGIDPITNTLVQGNRIGTDANGTAALPNEGYGIHVVAGTNVQIGGATAGARNLISGNLWSGIFVEKFATVYTTDMRVRGNFIGTDATGTVAIPNLQSGIEFSWAYGTIVGGTAPGEANVISGNHDHGVFFNTVLDASSNPNRVLGNLIGTNAFGTGPLGNGLAGVYFRFSVRGWDAGGDAAGEPNLIEYNGGAGLASDSGRSVRYRRNVIYSNGGLGIDRGLDGVTPNQPPGTFVFENFPILTDVSTSGAGTSVSGTLSSGYALAYAVHFLTNPTCDASGYGEARTYLGSVPVNTTAGAATPFSTTLPTPLPAGSYVTALAVAPDDSSNHGASSELSFCRQVSGGAPPGSVPLEILAVAPGRGGNTGNVTATVTGQGLLTGATVELKRTGSPDISGTSVAVSPEGSTLTAVFALTGAAQGLWDVVVTNPDTNSATLSAAFLVEAGVEPDIWADILGRGTLVVRAGREQTFFIVYGNRGNVDSEPVELRLSIPRQLKVTFMEEQDGSRPVYGLDKPMATGGSGESGINFYVRSIPAASSRVFAFRVLTVEADPGEFGQEVEMSLWFMSDPDLGPIVDAPHDPSVVLTPNVVTNDPGHLAMDIDVSGNSGSGTIHFDLTTADVDFEADPTVTTTVSGDDVTCVVRAAFTNSPPTEYTATIQGPQAAIDAALLYEKLTTSSQENIDKQEKGQMLRLAGLIDANGEATLENFRNGAKFTALADLATWVAPSELPGGQVQALNGVMQLAWEKKITFAARNDADWEKFLGIENSSGVTSKEIMSRLEEKLTDPKVRARIIRPLRVYLAIDPNEKAGPGGTTDAHYVSGAPPLPYTITFENVETASAAAQEVVVTDQLDLTKLDASTFELGPITFGKHVVEVPNGLTAYTADVDLRPEVDLIARVTAGFNAGTGVATWHFFSIDPATGQPTTDPLLGFLPPNVTTPRGEGHVAFTIRAKTGQASGTEIHNQASIVFDANAPIVTADWFNTLDVTAPSSQVATLPASGCTGIAVVWSGSDAHSGIESYDVLVSTNGGPFTPWLTGATATSGVFYGEVGSSYGFYSVAWDAAGNVEAPPGVADASTTVGAPSPLVDLLEPDSGPATGASVTLTGSGFEAGASVLVGGQAAGGVVVNDATSMSAIFPALAPGALYDVTAANASTCSDTFVKAWFADFSDVDGVHPFHDFVEKIFRRGITAGCATPGNYCPGSPVTRAQMAVFLIKAKYALSLVPPPATGTLFGDVLPGNPFSSWIEQLAKEGITGGCGGGNYCPGNPVTREQMAVFLLKAKYGAFHVPPPATGVFDDVPPGDPFAPWIEQLSAEGITGGCGGNNYCPDNPVTRGQMAVFITKTFGFD